MRDIVERLRATSVKSRVSPLQPHKTLWDEAADEIERLRQQLADAHDYLREVAAEAGLPPETQDIATCRHIAHQVKAIREGATQLFQQLAESQAIVDAARNLVAVKGRFHTEQAMKKLIAACSADELKGGEQG